MSTECQLTPYPGQPSDGPTNKKRLQGRPKETWRRTVERDLKARGLSLETAPRVATERDKWKSLVDASSASRHGED